MATTPSLDEKTIRTSPILWILGVLFAFFLGGLGTQGLSDVADLFPEPALSTWTERLVAPLSQERLAVEGRPDPRAPRIERARQDVADLDRTLSRAEESWRTWLDTRATLGGSKKEDDEIRDRRNRLDALRNDRDDAQQKLNALQAAPDPREEALKEVDHRIQLASAQANREYQVAERSWQWTVLMARLALVLPVLALALFLWRRRARMAYVTLLWGYWAFTVWMVLWGIGPYLPRYGGYGPLLLGLGASVWGSMSLARWLNSRASLRRRRIVDRAIARHRCPQCDRDYLLGRETSLDAGLARKSRTLHYDSDALHPRSCAACGLALFAPCPACRSLQLVHADRCSTCGAPRVGESAPVAG